jgi:hypothetical protein
MAGRQLLAQKIFSDCFRTCFWLCGEAVISVRAQPEILIHSGAFRCEEPRAADRGQVRQLVCRNPARKGLLLLK